MAKMNFTPADDLVDEVWGKIGTPERDAMETRLKEEVRAYRKAQLTASKAAPIDVKIAINV